MSAPPDPRHWEPPTGPGADPVIPGPRAAVADVRVNGEPIDLPPGGPQLAVDLDDVLDLSELAAGSVATIAGLGTFRRDGATTYYVVPTGGTDPAAEYSFEVTRDDEGGYRERSLGLPAEVVKQAIQAGLGIEPAGGSAVLTGHSQPGSSPQETMLYIDISALLPADDH